MKWDTSDHGRHEVVEYTNWRLLRNYESLEWRAGVYVFADGSHQVKYVGKAGPGRMVNEVGDAIRRGKHYGSTLVKALYTNSDEKARSLESYLIRKYQPPNNRG